jgi:hypothetical protein
MKQKTHKEALEEILELAEKWASEVQSGEREADHVPYWNLGDIARASLGIKIKMPKKHLTPRESDWLNRPRKINQ